MGNYLIEGGIFKRTLVGIFEYVFEEMNFNKIYCEVFTSNSHAIRNIYLKCGMEVEGTLRGHVLKRNQWRDVLYMGLLKQDWNKKKDFIECKKYKFVIAKGGI